ncbi:pirin family protein [Endozoicomonas gorgoniicola]|uniref:Pirin family protein n=1 Tax=Endozoicomonas gorgoniicola TaxID=1234144 RepID=A0ABT3MQ87_9GAMM|nr:pirin family protein [Endozoicomonas gorgoniicola]MCW7551530.1 pirin family protein [Endozoicomonas gorgoniicola]
MNSTRSVIHSVDAVPASDGAGVQLKRIMSQPPHQLMDPFLMLDELKADHKEALGGGFPPHPHRGIETISCMLVGGFRHEDHMGNRREVGNGGIQWMKSGRGVIHSEMPLPEQDRLHGFQVWLNMPRRAKMDDPQYLDIDREAIPEWPLPEGKCRVLVGSLKNNDIQVQAPVVRQETQALMLDVQMEAGDRVVLPVTLSKAMIYVYQGVVNVAGSDSVISVGQSTLAVLSESGDLELTASEQSGFLVLAGEPLNEPVVQSGPFVMNTREEIEQAFQEYRAGELIAK